MTEKRTGATTALRCVAVLSARHRGLAGAASRGGRKGPGERRRLGGLHRRARGRLRRALPTETAIRSPTTVAMRRATSSPPRSTRRRKVAGSAASANRGWLRIQPHRRRGDREPGEDQPVARAQRLHQQRVRVRGSQPSDREHDGDRVPSVLGVRREQRPAKEPAELSRRAARLREARRPLGRVHRRSHADAVLARRDRHRRDVRAPLGRRLAGKARQQRPDDGHARLRRPRLGLLVRGDLRHAECSTASSWTSGSSIRCSSRAAAPGRAPASLRRKPS